MSSSAARNVFEQDIVSSPPKLADLDVEVVDKPTLAGAPSKPSTVGEPIEATHVNHPAFELHSSENCGNMEALPAVSDESSSKEEHNSEEVKIGRMKSLPAKQEYSENASQNTLSLPSYMAATESAKQSLELKDLLSLKMWLKMSGIILYQLVTMAN